MRRLLIPAPTRFLGWVLVLFFCHSAQAADERLYGALQSTVAHAEEGYKAGWRVAVISVAWDAFEPTPDKVNEGYVREVLEKVKAFRALGYRLQLDLGMQYPPGWIFELPHARYKNQFGDEYKNQEPGKRIPNYVFNAAVRERLARFMGKVFDQLGTDWDWVRLGGGFYGEVNFPQHAFASNTNCYWAFDDLAQGRADGLPDGLSPCPVPGWIPGTASPEHDSARRFLDWYHGALQHYHDWQITTVRRSFEGEICMLYGSWGVRPGRIEKALEVDLDGSSQGEHAGEIATGYAWERMIGGIKDPKVIVYCTWIDAPPEHCDDDGEDKTRWSPVHWQASLARENPLNLRVWGENTGGNDRAAMQVVFERIKRFGLMGVMWAFEHELFADPNPKKTATFSDFAEFIRENADRPAQ